MRYDNTVYGKIIFINNVGNALCNNNIDAYSNFGKYILNIIKSNNLDNEINLNITNIDKIFDEIDLLSLEQLYTNVIDYLY